jgi:hypothetical protein
MLAATQSKQHDSNRTEKAELARRLTEPVILH